MKTGDLIKTRCFGPSGTVGDLGLLLDYDALRGGWWVQFAECEMVIAKDGLEVISENRRPGKV